MYKGCSLEAEVLGTTGNSGEGSAQGSSMGYGFEICSKEAFANITLHVTYSIMQNTVHWLSYMEDSRDHHYANHQGWKFKHFCPLLLGIGVTKENMMQSGSNGLTLYQHREEREQDWLQWWVSVPQGSQVSPRRQCRAIYLPTLFLSPCGGTCLLPAEDRYSSVVHHVQYDATLKQDKGADIELTIG